MIHKRGLFLRRLFRDTRGLTAVTVAVSMPVLFGVAGLGIDTGLWYTIKRQNQSAADAAAISAAYEVMAGNTSVTNNLTPAATQAATRNDYTGTTPVVTYPYTDTVVCAQVPNCISGVKVTLSQTQNAWFSSWFPAFTSFTIANEAVAIVEKLDNACILALEATGTGIGLTGNYSVATPNCTIAADSASATAIDGVGNGCISAYTLVSAGEYSFTGNSTSPCTSNGYNLSSPPIFGGANIANPYAATLTHTFLTTGMPTNTCGPPTITGPAGAATYSYPSNCDITGGVSLSGNDTINLSGGTQIAGGLSFTGNGTVNLSPGTYWITDGSLQLTGNITLQCPNCSPGGAGVTIIFTTTKGSAGTIGTLLPTGNVTITLNAPGSGYLMLQDTVAGATYTSGGTVGNAGSTLSGLLYFPSTGLAFVGNIQTTSNCLVAVANQFTFTGNIGLSSSGCPTALTVPTLKTVALAE